MRLKVLSDSPAAERFARTALEFCTLIETAASRDRDDFFRRCFPLVARLLYEVTDLPAIEGNLDTMRSGVTREAYGMVVQAIKNQSGERDYYRTVFSPLSPDDEAVYGSVSDDLADMWCDLKVELLALDRGNPANAISDWRFSFRYHWGPHHATQLLRPLLALMFDEDNVKHRRPTTVLFPAIN